jgi:hypothetical protein
MRGRTDKIDIVTTLFFKQDEYPGKLFDGIGFACPEMTYLIILAEYTPQVA